MATIRRRIITALADLLDAGLDWDVVVLKQVNQLHSIEEGVTRVGVVSDQSETKRIVNGAGCEGGEYECDLSIEVRVIVNPAAAAAGVDIYDEVDEAIGELEALIPWQSDLQPVFGFNGVKYCTLTGSRKDEPDNETGIPGATLNVEITYKHDIDNPSTIGGSVP